MAMAKITLTCIVCGREFEIRKPCYNRQAVIDYENWARSNITECKECRAVRLHAEEFFGVNETIPLFGTEKQVDWAKTLRAKYVKRVLGFIRGQEDELARLDALNSILAEHTDARYWIDHRDDPTSSTELREMLLLRVAQQTSSSTEEAAEKKKISTADKCDILASCFIEVLKGRETGRSIDKLTLKNGRVYSFFIIQFESSNSDYSSGTIEYYWGRGGYFWKNHGPHDYSESARIPKEINERAHVLFREKMDALNLI